MSDRKPADKAAGPGRQTVVLLSRRREEVRRNFAVGIRRIMPDRMINRGQVLKTGQGHTA